LEFLNLVVEAEQKRNLGRTGYLDNEDWPNNKAKVAKEEKIRQQDVPMAASLYTREASCIFCGGKHQSQECFKAKSLTPSERESKVFESNSCYSCLTKGHWASSCRGFVRCLSCGKKHAMIMCQGDNGVSSQNRKLKKEEVETSASNLVSQKKETVATLSN